MIRRSLPSLMSSGALLSYPVRWYWGTWNIHWGGRWWGKASTKWQSFCFVNIQRQFFVSTPVHQKSCTFLFDDSLLLRRPTPRCYLQPEKVVWTENTMMNHLSKQLIGILCSLWGSVPIQLARGLPVRKVHDSVTVRGVDVEWAQFSWDILKHDYVAC